MTSTASVAADFGGSWSLNLKMGSITNTISDLGNGATGIVFGSRGANQIGHFFNVVNQNGTIRFLDFQKSGSAIMTTSEVSSFKSLWFLNTTPQ